MTVIHLKFVDKLLMFSVSFACTLFALPLLCEAADFTWGQLNKYTSPIYDKEILLTDDQQMVEIIYPEKGCNYCNDYIITSMHVFDMQTPALNEAANGKHTHQTHSGDIDLTTADSALVEVLRGGIGYNYTTLRFQIPPPAYQYSAVEEGDIAGGNGVADEPDRKDIVRAHYLFVIYGISI